MRRFVPFLALLATLPGCGSEIILGDSDGDSDSDTAPTDAALPTPGELLWSAEHEVGDFSEWERGGSFYGGQYEWGDVSGYVAAGVGRGGSHGVVATINTAARRETSGGVRMYRRIEASGAFYSAWYRLEGAHRVHNWWSIFLFHARDETLSLEDDVSLWDVRVVDDASGQLWLEFFDHDTQAGMRAPVGRGAAQPGEWFQVQAYLDFRPPAETRLVVWQDDQLLFDLKGLRTAKENHVYWCAGNGAGKLSPAESVLYLDDAAVRASAAP